MAGGIGVYKFIRHITSERLLALLAMLHYFLLQGHFATLSADYHDVVPGSAVVSWFIYFFSREKFLPASLVFIFSMTSKENMPVWLVFICIVLIISFYNRKNLIFGLSLIGLAILYFVLVFWVIIPYFEDPQRPHWAFHYKAFGATPSEVFRYFILHPFDTFLKMFYNHVGLENGKFVKPEYYLYFMIGGGWLLFRKPLLLLMFLPVIAQKMLLDYPSRWSLGAYHSVEIESIYSLAVFWVIASLRTFRHKSVLGVAITLVTLVSTVYLLNNSNTYWRDLEKENIFGRKMYQSHLNPAEIKKDLNSFRIMQQFPPSVALFPILHSGMKFMYSRRF